jgi:DNA-binding beta-propeller fold protein YncE
MNHLLKRYRFLLIAGLFLFSVNTVQSQDTTYVDVLDFSETNTVSWVNQIPTLKQDKKREKKGWFKKLLFGKNGTISFQKPVNVIGMNLDNCIIFDQGNGTIFISEDDKLEIPKLLRKKETYFPSLVGACMLPGNRLLFTDSKLNKIFTLSEDQKVLTELNKNLTLSQPTGIAYSKLKDQIWVVETSKHQIHILNINGEHIKTIGNRGKGESEFNFPTSIWIDNNGRAYVVDALNYRIQIFDVDGNFISMFGENGNGTGFMARPKGIATDSFGNIYVVDALFHVVQIFDQQGNYLYQFGTQGRDTAEFWMPSGIFIDKTNHIYIADSYNKRIQIFKLNYTQ